MKSVVVADFDSSVDSDPAAVIFDVPQTYPWAT